MPASRPDDQWRHGWIPESAAAAKSKNHGRTPSSESQGADDWIRASAKGKAPRKVTTTGASAHVKDTPVKDPKAFLSRYDDWRKNLSPGEDKAMRFYQSPGFALMNGQLRGRDPGELKRDVHATDDDLKRARAASANLRKAIAKAPPLEHDTTVYRGFDAGQFGDLTPGKVVTDKGFTSTSLTNDAGAVGKGSGGQATILLPEGTRAGAGSARELVLPPGSSFKIVKVERRGKTTHVTMEYVPPKH